MTCSSGNVRAWKSVGGRGRRRCGRGLVFVSAVLYTQKRRTLSLSLLRVATPPLDDHLQLLVLPTAAYRRKKVPEFLTAWPAWSVVHSMIRGCFPEVEESV
jgi:hypothetical protein